MSADAATSPLEFRPSVEALEARDVPATGPSSSQSAYIVPSNPAINTTSILTAGDSVPDANGVAGPLGAPSANYRMAGVPDGLGAFDNGDGTFTVLMTHELRGTGIAREHGSGGAFVSRYVIRKSDLAVLSGDDLIKSLRLWNGTTYVTGTSALFALCSADLPPVSGLFNAATGLGTADRIFFGGEEGGAGRAFAHVVTGTDAGISYELPRLGSYAHENVLVRPVASDATLVASTEDAFGGQIHFYTGTKTSTGSVIDKAGLTNGTLYQLAVTGFASENAATGIGGPGVSRTFTLTTGAGTGFQRPEDGAWDPASPNDFYFVTTEGAGPARLWRVRFTDANDPLAGGTITEVLNSSQIPASSTGPAQAFDNITIDPTRRLLINEDTGDSYVGRVYAYDITGSTDAVPSVREIAAHDPARFAPGGTLTTNEESSGVLDVSAIFGPGTYLLDVQAHTTNGLPAGTSAEVVENGQLLFLQIAQPTVAAPSLSTPQETPVSGQLTGTDPAGLGLTYEVVSQPTHGTLTAFNTSTGAFTYTPTAGYAGGDSFTARSRNTLANSPTVTVTSTPTPPPPARTIVLGTGAGPTGVVRLLDAMTRLPLREFAPFPGYRGGLAVAAADVNRDGTADVVAATATATGVGHLKVLDGLTGVELWSLLPFGGYFGGLVVAAGDVDGDGRADVIVGTATGSSHVKVFSGATGQEIRSFLAFPGFAGGVRVAAGDVTGDGRADIAVVAGPGGNGHVKVFDAKTGATVVSFLSYNGYSGEIDVTAGDVDRDERAEIVTVARNPERGTHVEAYSAAARNFVRNFFVPPALPTDSGAALAARATAPPRVCAADVTGDGAADILLGSPPQAGSSRLIVADGETGRILESQLAFDPLFAFGIDVAAG